MLREDDHSLWHRPRTAAFAEATAPTGERRSLTRCELQNGVICRTGLFEHNDLRANHGVSKFGSQVVSDQLVHFSVLDMSHFHSEIDRACRVR